MNTESETRLAVLDFEHEIERLTEDFTGREWIFTEIDKWLKRENERFFILTGEPGVGKSAIAAQLTQVRADKIAAYHFCVAGNIGTIIPNAVLRSLAAQLGDSLSGYGEALANTIKPNQVRINVNQHVEKVGVGVKVVGVIINNITASNPDEELDILFRAPLTELKPPTEPFFILIDSLDEAATYAGQINLITLLAKANDLPPWARFVCTTRPAETILSHFQHFKSYTLAAESQMNLDDLKRYIGYRIAKDAMQTQLQSADVKSHVLEKQVAELADGNFLYTKILLNDIETGQQPLDDLSALPTSLDEIYQGFLRRFSDDDWDQRYQPLLGKLAVAQEQISEDLLASFARLRPRQVRRSLGVLAQYLDTNENELGEEIYRLFHQSLRDYLLDKGRSGLFWCDPKEEHELIADHYTKHYQDKWQDCDGYGLRNLPLHLVGADQHQRLRELLINFNWLQAKLEATDINAPISDYDLLEMANESDRPFAIIQSALQLSAHVLGLDKTQLASQLAGRLINNTSEETSILLDSITSYEVEPWLRSYATSLTPAGGPLRRTLSGMNSTNGVIVTPDDRLALCHDDDSILWIWDLDSGALRQSIETSFRAFLNCSVGHPTKPLGVVGKKDGGIFVIDIEAAKILRELPSSGELEALTLSGDGCRVWSSHENGTVEDRPIDGNEDRREIEIGSEAITAIAASDDSCAFLSMSSRIEKWDLTQPKCLQIFEGHANSISALVLSLDGQYLAAGFDDGSIDLWNLPEASRRTLAGHQEQVSRNIISDLEFTPRGDSLISASWDTTVRVWDVASCNLSATLSGHSSSVYSVAVFKNGISAISSSEDGTLRVWDLTAKALTETTFRHAAGVDAIAARAENAIAISGSRDRKICVWDLLKGVALRHWDAHEGEKPHEGWIEAIAIDPSGVRIHSGSSDGFLRTWNLADGKSVVSVRGDWGSNRNMAISDDGNLFVSDDSGYDKVRLSFWRPGRKRKIGKVEVRRSRSTYAVSTDGTLVIAGDMDGGFDVIDTRTPEVLWSQKGKEGQAYDYPESITINPDASQAVIGFSHGYIESWDLNKREKLGTFALHTDPVVALAISPDGALVCSASWDRTLRVWELETSKLIATFSSDDFWCSCAFGGDSRRILAGDERGSVHFLYLEGWS